MNLNLGAVLVKKVQLKIKKKEIKKHPKVHLKLKTFIIEEIELINQKRFLNVLKLKMIWGGVTMLIFQQNITGV